MQNGDVIVKVDDKDIKDFEDLANILANHKPGNKLSFGIKRAGKDQSLSVTLGEQPRQSNANRRRERASAFLGVQTAPLTPELKTQLGFDVDAGAVVMEVVPGTPAAKAGVEGKDVITGVNGTKIADPRELRQAIRKAGTGTEVTLEVIRGKDKKELKATLEEAPFGLGEFPFPGSPLTRPGISPFAPSDDQRVRKLEHRIEELEKRLHELEQKQGQPPS
jgi:serine protease Do